MSPDRGKFSPLILVLAGLFVSAFAPRARADIDATMNKGVQFLKGQIGGAQVGETALIALAMLKAEVPANDPSLMTCITRIEARCAGGGYDPERTGGSEIYEAAVRRAGTGQSRARITAHPAALVTVARFFIGKQKTNGSWDYTQREAGDTSISQYAVLGLWEADNAGAVVDPAVWERAANWFMSSQASGGSWNYHRDETNESHPETLSMTAAGVGSLLICQRQLAKYRRPPEALTPLLIPLSNDGRRARYDVTLPNNRVDQAVKKGLNWMAANFTVGNSPIVGQTPYYGLYGIERMGALAGRDTLGRADWFEQGRHFITTTQGGTGGWSGQHGEVANTVWAILFLTKSTAKTLTRITVKALGAGTLLGGRGLPRDLSSLTVAGGKVVSRPMNGAVEGMLAALEDPRGEHADSALAGLVTRYQNGGPAALRPHKDRFRKMLGDRDPGLRRLAAWALARTGELDVVPLLIEAITDADESVVVVAREGLQLLSRKAVGLGPPSSSTPEQRSEAAKRWRAWYATIRPLDVEGQDEKEPSPSALRSAR